MKTITALYATPADLAFVTVSDISTDSVGPDGVSFSAAFLGAGYAVDWAPRDEEVPGRAAPAPQAGPESVAPPAHEVGPVTIPPPLDAK